MVRKNPFPPQVKRLNPQMCNLQELTQFIKNWDGAESTFWSVRKYTSVNHGVEDIENYIKLDKLKTSEFEFLIVIRA